jgi:hypothetical protein
MDIFKKGISPQELGIGGQNEALKNIIRRCLLSRSLTPEQSASVGVKHVKGVLLYGMYVYMCMCVLFVGKERKEEKRIMIFVYLYMYIYYSIKFLLYEVVKKKRRDKFILIFPYLFIYSFIYSFLFLSLNETRSSWYRKDPDCSPDWQNAPHP